MESQKLSEKDGVVSVFPNKIFWPQTTRSWDFLGFSLTVLRQLNLESDIIVGMIDSGIWPESESFSDKGLGPPPKKWKGSCKDFPCNNKIIGARWYSSDRVNNLDSPVLDTEGHGTHTASIVAGVSVNNASLNHIAEGTARGAVPSARLAVYKVCWPRGAVGEGCSAADILAAMDDAIADGVDIISASIGHSSPLAYLEDPLAIGSFHASMHGILTSAAAGNAGPDAKTVSNVAPWLMSIAASTIDRKIVSKLVLGDKQIMEGNAINAFDTEKQFRPLVAATGANGCKSLGPEVAGKIVLCNEGYEGDGPRVNHAYGQVRVQYDVGDYADSYAIPTTLISTNNSLKVMEYIKQTRGPVAYIHRSEGVFDSNAPTVLSYSSRGPNTISPGILKPDVAAPGVEILAAWSPEASPSVEYNIYTGTSMACPHATGAAAYVKSFHPSWSPAAIRSALMTTATPMNATRSKEAEFAYGSGQIDPVKAVNPGLVYEATSTDYIMMLCSDGYTTKQIQQLAGDNFTCPEKANHTASNLNYPSIAYAVGTSAFSVSFPRRVTNVGSANSVYTVKISSDPRMTVTVSPEVLHFSSLEEEKEFAVTISSKGLPIDLVSYSASIVWFDGEHIVRSPVIVYHDQ